MLAFISEKRNQKDKSAKTNPPPPARGETIVLLDSSSENESEEGHQHSGKQPGGVEDLCSDDSSPELQQSPRPALRRFQKRDPTCTDAAADSMAGLSIGQQQRNTAPAASALPDPSPEASTESEACTSMEAGLVLGDNSEFQLAKVVSQLLYAHQVCALWLMQPPLAVRMRCCRTSRSSMLACRWML